jgi:hypothetical protein
VDLALSYRSGNLLALLRLVRGSSLCYSLLHIRLISSGAVVIVLLQVPNWEDFERADQPLAADNGSSLLFHLDGLSSLPLSFSLLYPKLMRIVSPFSAPGSQIKEHGECARFDRREVSVKA